MKKVSIEDYVKLYGEFAPVRLDINGDGFVDEEEFGIAKLNEERVNRKTQTKKIEQYYF